MKAEFKLLVFGAAFAGAIASAQSPEPSGAAVPVIPDPNPAIMPSGNATPGGNTEGSATPSSKAAAPAAQPTGNSAAPPAQQARVPANRENDVIKACSDVPAADVEACIARENARRQSGTPSAGHTSGSKSKGSTASNGGPSSTSDSTSPSATKSGSTRSSMRSAGEDSANAEGTTKK